MATPNEVSEYRTVIDQLSTVAISDAKSLLTEVADPNPEVVRDRLQESLAPVLQPYVTAAGEFSATWYEELRRKSQGGSFTAEAVDDLPEARVAGITRYAVAPLFGQSSVPVLSLLAAGLQKAIADAGRDTVSTNIHRDSTTVRYARSPKAGCCAFCAMLASRGAVYLSAASAGAVVGRGVESHRAYSSRTGRYIGMRGGGVKTGARSVGEKYHSFCRCVATPIWEGDDLPYDLTHYEDMYQKLSGSGVKTDENGRTYYQSVNIDTKSLLSAMREQFGIK